MTYEEGPINIRTIDDLSVGTVAESKSRIPPAAIAIGPDLIILWSRLEDDVLTAFNYGARDPQKRASAPSSSGNTSIQAHLRWYGLKVDVPHDLVVDIANGINIFGAGAGLAALAYEDYRKAVALFLSALTRLGMAVLQTADRGNGISVLVPWTAVVPIPPPFGTGGVVIPLPYFVDEQPDSDPVTEG